MREGENRGKARNLFAIADVHVTDHPVFLGNLDEVFLLLLEFDQFLLQVLDFALATRLLQAATATQKGDLLVRALSRQCKFVLEALDLQGHGVVAVAAGLRVREALELGRNFLVLLVFRLEVADFGIERKAAGFQVRFDFGHLLVDFGGTQVAAAFEGVNFAGNFRNAESQVRTVDFDNRVAHLEFLAGNHVNLHDFGCGGHADNGFVRIGDAAEHGDLALVDQAKNDSKNNTEGPSQRQLVSIDVGDTRIVLVGVPEIVEKIFKFVHRILPLHFRRCVLHHELDIRNSLDLGKVIQDFGSGLRRTQANLVGDIQTGAAINFAHGDENESLEARLHDMFDLGTGITFVRESKAEHTVKEVLSTETRTGKEESDTAEGNRTADSGSPGIHTAADTRT